MPPYNQDNNQIIQSANSTGPILTSSKSKIWLIISLIVAVILLVVALIFAFWAYGQMKDYKNNTDQKISTAVKDANATQKQQLDAQFAEQAKLPSKTYTTPSQYSSVKVVYPKTWSAYVIEQINNTSLPVDGYFYPDFVPGINLNGVNYFLRIQIVGDSYSNILNQYSSQIKQGTLRATSFIPEQVKGATAGIRLDGQLGQNKNGSIIILPVRDKVLKIWSENNSAINDFNNIVLKNLSYSP